MSNPLVRRMAVAAAVAIAVTLPACASNEEATGGGAGTRAAVLRTAAFQGPKANTGAVRVEVEGRTARLSFTDDFVTPDTPDPHWQVVDAQGRTYLLQRIDIKDMKSHRSIVLPPWIGSVARVQIWCAFAETNLGEARLEPAVVVHTDQKPSHAMGRALVQQSSRFEGPKANTGAVVASRHGSATRLTLTDDFVVPDTPDPHWQIVDSAGRAHLLQRLPIKGGAINRSIEVPAYVQDIERVQIWCAFAEVVLGEATFAGPAAARSRGAAAQ